MNEKGLVVELMWLDGAKYPKADDRPSLSVLQWIEYQLDNCTTIEEVIATDKKIRISSAGSPPLHYLVADSGGNAATIEFLNEKMVVHKGNDLPFPVLTNTEYATATKMVKSANNGTNSASPSFNDNSVERFAVACSMLQQFRMADSNQSLVDFSFNVLGRVSQPGWTRWSIVYDLNNKTIYFKTARFPSVKSISFADFDFTCNSEALALNMNQTMEGKVSNQFKNFTLEINRRLIEQSVEESKSQVTISEMDRKKLMEYPGLLRCQ